MLTLCTACPWPRSAFSARSSPRRGAVVPSSAGCHRLQYPLESSAYFLGNRLDAFVSSQRKRRHGIHGGHGTGVGFIAGVDDDVAGEKKPDVALGTQCLVCQRWVAGTQDDVGPELHVELL